MKLEIGTVDIVFWVVIAVALFFIFCPDRDDSQPVPLVDTWSKPLNDAGYTHAVTTKPQNIPDDKNPPAGEPVLHATGTVTQNGTDDTQIGTVELVGVQTPDGRKWLTGWVDGRQIVFDRLDWWQPAYDDDSDFSLFMETALVSGRADVGVGAGYAIWHPVGLDLGAAVSFDLNRDLYDTPDWIAVSGRLSRSYDWFNVGAELGYRFGEDAGVHVGAGVGLNL